MEVMSLEQVLYRSLKFNPKDVDPLIKYLEMEPPKGNPKQKAQAIEKRVREMGSNDIATFFRGAGVPYKEVVEDVAKHLGVDGLRDSWSVVKIEQKILEHVFRETLNKMSEKEQRELFANMNLDTREIPFGSSSALLMQTIGRMGGFSTFKIAVVTANFVSRALFNRGLSVAGNALLTRGIGVALGPIGWIASGAWLAADIAGPAMRATVPTVVHIAYLRKIARNRITIGVIGDGSTGKDSLLRAVFGIDTGQISPIAGSTSDAEIYALGDSGGIQLINYPGFEDVREKINRDTRNKLDLTDIFLLVLDSNRGGSKLDKGNYEKRKGERPTLICANKWDLVRPENRERQLADLIQKLGLRTKTARTGLVTTSFDPDSRLGEPVQGIQPVREWLFKQLEDAGKDTTELREQLRANKSLAVKKS